MHAQKWSACLVFSCIFTNAVISPRNTSGCAAARWTGGRHVRSPLALARWSRARVHLNFHSFNLRVQIRWTGYVEIRYFPPKIHNRYDSETMDERHNVSGDVVWLKNSGRLQKHLGMFACLFFFLTVHQFFVFLIELVQHYNVWINFEIICKPDGLYSLSFLNPLYSCRILNN